MRRRRIGRKKKQDRYGAITAVLLLLLVAAFIYAFQSLGIYDILFKPTFSTNTGSPAASTAATASASNTAGATATASVSATGAKVSDEIKLNSISLYGVQLGVFTKLENAQAASDKYKKEGAAGYILKEDTLYRVIDSVYISESDAKAVRDVYRKGSCPDACCIRVQASGVNWKINASRAQIDSIRTCLLTTQSQIVALINMQKTAQQKQGSATDYKTVLSATSDNLKTAGDNMKKTVGTSNSAVITALNQCIADSSGNLSKLAKTDPIDDSALLAGIKYNIIDLLIKLQNNVLNAS